MGGRKRLRRCLLGLLGSVCWWLLSLMLLIPMGLPISFLVCSLVRCDFPEVCSGGVDSNVTDLQVVLASVGQTGTTSVAQALRQMGYRSWHIEEKTTYAPDTCLDLESPEVFARPVARCKVESISLEPGTDALPYVLQTSPKAKVILTWRDYPSWLASTSSGGSNKDFKWGVFQAIACAPYNFYAFGYVMDALAGGALREGLKRGDPMAGAGEADFPKYLLRLSIGVYAYNAVGTNVYERGVFKVGGQEESYLAHMDEIRKLAEGRLLEMDVRKHGWAELSKFLGRPPPPGDLPFPHPRSKESWTNDTMFDHNLHIGVPAILFMLSVMVLNVLFVRALVRGLLWLGSVAFKKVKAKAV